MLSFGFLFDVDRVEKGRRVDDQLALADAFNDAHFLQGLRLKKTHLAQRRVGKYHIGWDMIARGQRAANGAEPLEKLAVGRRCG